jgi:hypothetical protein
VALRATAFSRSPPDCSTQGGQRQRGVTATDSRAAV